MARMVADSSALILLAKCSLLEIVCKLFEVVVPKTVTIEVASEDLIRNYPDLALISDLISKGAKQRGQVSIFNNFKKMGDISKSVTHSSKEQRTAHSSQLIADR